ncbi:adenine nucleotide alpha hydrolase family protein [Streptomyces europaeiscabiei]|uniref:hypothetical protein n=1 Tax=Streptomyces europaeiscabiei TaxID=146819 RepID=UPI0029B65924|nr:hypothetical protein [Streptomyces europaeiscabiei]MDX3672770.1 hypothetical protein [Streptomyces europaeiscabiei]
MPEPAYRFLSLGAGVQSTTLLLLSAEGALPKIDGAVFSDTGWEPRAVYDHLDRLEQEVAKPAGIPIYRVSSGNIRSDALDPEARFAQMPLYVRAPDGGDGMLRRACTDEYKVTPIKAKVRQLLGYPHPTRVPTGVFAEQWIGISIDEASRAARMSNDVQYMRSHFPLMFMRGGTHPRGGGWTRNDCTRYLTSHGFQDTPKSACIGCPYTGNARWRRLRDTCGCGHHRDEHSRFATGWACAHLYNPDAGDAPADVCTCPGFHNPEWTDAVDFDQSIRHGNARAIANGTPLDGEAFLHRSRLPLDEAPIDRVTRNEWAARQTDVFDQIADAEADDRGCSPWVCRGEDDDE